jgi:dimethylamine monooxygenase subunit A
MRRLPLVFLDGPWKLAMGLGALDPADWLWRDERFAAETAERAALAAARPGEVHALLPEAEPAARELLAMVVGHLERDHGTWVQPDPGASPLLGLVPLAQEDFCLMQRRPAGAYALTGAILCFPAHWRLKEKLGRPLAEIHAPVPGFNERLGGPADRFFRNLAVERPVWRANWSVVESPDLFHPQPRGPLPGLSAENAGRLLWLRVERQTLRRLPATGAVAFTIRTLVRRLDRVAGEPGVAAAMAARVREMDEGTAAYKGIPALRGPLLAYLDALADAAETPARAGVA